MRSVSRGVRASLAEKKWRVGFASLFSPRMRFIMLIAFGIAFFQQITGINAIFYYLPTIFAQAGGALSDAFGQAVLVGMVNVGMTFVAIWLIDRLGRKPLLTIGVAGMAVSLLTISWAFSQAQYGSSEYAYETARPRRCAGGAGAGGAIASSSCRASRNANSSPRSKRSSALTRIEPHRQALGGAALNTNARLVLFAIIGFVASFAISLGPVMWVLLSEIFPNEHRGAAISVVGFWNSLVSASVTFIFPVGAVHARSRRARSWSYGLFAVAALLFVLLVRAGNEGPHARTARGRAGPRAQHGRASLNDEQRRRQRRSEAGQLTGRAELAADARSRCARSGRIDEHRVAHHQWHRERQRGAQERRRSGDRQVQFPPEPGRTRASRWAGR